MEVTPDRNLMRWSKVIRNNSGLEQKTKPLPEGDSGRGFVICFESEDGSKHFALFFPGLAIEKQLNYPEGKSR